MPNFSYQAYLANGQLENGNLEASNEREAASLLSAQRKQVFRIKEVQTKSRASFNLNLSGKPDLQRIFEDLSELVASGMKVDVAIKIMSENASNRVNKKFAKDALSGIVSGQSLSASLSKIEFVTPDIVALIAAGEESGRLADVLSIISDDLKTNSQRKRELFETLSYPIFLIMIMFLAVFAIAGFLVPAIEPLFVGSGSEPPTVLKAFAVLRDISDELLFGIVTAVLVAGLSWALPSLRRPTSRSISYCILKLPTIGKAIQSANTGSFLRSLSIMAENSVPIHEAAKLAVDSVRNASIHERLIPVSSQLVEGKDLPNVLEDTGVFEPEIVSIISIGHRVNKLATVLKRSADLLDARSERTIKRLTALLAPSITIVMGLLIGTLAYSVMTALLSINELAV